MVIDDGFPNYWPDPQPTPMWDYEKRIPETIASLYEWVEVLKEIEYSKAARDQQRGGVYRLAEVEKVLWGIHNSAEHILEMIRVLDGFPEMPAFRKAQQIQARMAAAEVMETPFE